MFIFTIFALIILAKSQTLIESLFSFTKEAEEHAEIEPDDTPILKQKYDFVVVGAGTAGCVIANRLTENPNWSVLLIEAGGSELYPMDIPGLTNSLQQTSANWKYQSVPSNNYCLGMENQQCNIPRGKVLGGSSTINNMIYTRGNSRDYDHWAEIGNVGWSYTDVLPYFKKVENFKVNNFSNSKYHSQDGYVNVEDIPFRTRKAKAAVQAEIETGAKYVDYNAETQVGISYIQATMQDGVRESASRTYLHPIKNRENFHLKKNSIVSKILINPVNLRAQGVEFVHEGEKYVVKSKKEVIVSAGAINSPQLLMLSGIGPREHLESIEIPVLRNLQVGSNLMDHISLGGVTFLINNTDSNEETDSYSLKTLKEYFSFHKGPFSIPGGCEVISFHDSKNQDNPNGHPDLELLYIPSGWNLETRSNFGIDKDLFINLYGSVLDKDSFMVFPIILQPKSRGKILLQDNNYLSKPLIYPNYLNDTEDVKTLIAGVKLVLNIIQQPAMKSLGATLYTKVVPNCKDYEFGTDIYWKCLARVFTLTIYHQSGTCKMGSEDDNSTVVNSRLKVHGMKGLRVIDSSIMPMIPAAHTNAPTLMIAEKGADMVKEDWNMH